MTNKRNALQRSAMRGFTLVEIAIVVVIAGLLVGGIFKGTDLINSARVRSAMDQQVSIQIAWDSFINRYKELPGDYPNAADHISGAATPPASTMIGAVSGDGVIIAIESPIVFQHLTAAGLLRCPACVQVTLGMPSPENSPVNPYGGLLAIYSDNVYAGDHNNERRLALWSVQIPANVLHEIDAKIDDSHPGTGVFRGALISSQANEQNSGTLFTCLADEDGMRLGTVGAGTAPSDVDATKIWIPATQPSNSNCGSALLL
ncbi:MAG: type II secretion system protein [Gammaproteobacteria bacterium WSBS_2016_MAG_OTU1]